jgi:hypothetical protein
MEKRQFNSATTLEGWKGLETKGWYAWNDLMPPKPDYVHVTGEVLAPNPGIDAELTYREPQGINPAILVLDLRLHQKAGFWPEMLVWKSVKYEAVLSAMPYSRVTVFSNDKPIVGLDVDTVQTPTSLIDIRGTRALASEVPLPRRTNGAWSGENPFPWLFADHPFCFSGSVVSAPPVSICMDGVPYVLNIQQNMNIRLSPGNDRARAALEEAANKRIMITACGHFALGVEAGCQYFVADRVTPVEEFSAMLRS